MPQILGEVCDKFWAVAEEEDGGEERDEIVCGGVGEGVDDVEDEFCWHVLVLLELLLAVAGTGLIGLNTSGPFDL